MHLEDGLWTTLLDPSQLDQILMNMSVNARDAMPEGGALTIRTSNVTVDANYCCDRVYAMPGEYVLLEVSDEGVGMDAETIGHVFEPFFTTKEVGRGTGLGMATVYGIVKQNAGFINAYSEPGQGSTFRIYFPRVLADEAPQESESIQIPRATGTVLLVEDSDQVREMVTGMLETIGYSVLAVGDPYHALSLAKKRDLGIDLLITDVVMPGMNGAELSEKVLAVRPETKVIFMSGYTGDRIAHRGVLKKGCHFIQKPFSMVDMAMKIREVGLASGSDS